MASVDDSADAGSTEWVMMADLVQCKLCFKAISNPRVLSGCRHMFCFDCLWAWWQESSESDMNSVICPTCRVPCALPTEGVSALLSDIKASHQGDMLKQSIVVVNKVEVGDANTCSASTTGPATTSTVVSSLPCDVCSLDAEGYVEEGAALQSPAVKYCNDCQNHLCEKCSGMHAATSIFARHKVHDLGKVKGPAEVLCSKHPGKALKYFCTTCPAVACSVCVTTQHSQQGHSVAEIGDMVESRQPEIKRLLDEVRIMSQGLDNRDAITEQLVMRTKDAFWAVEKHVSDHADRCRKEIEEAEIHLLEEIETRKSVAIQRTREEGKKRNYSIIDLETLQAYGARLLTSVSPLEFVSNCGELKDRLDTVLQFRDKASAMKIKGLGLKFVAQQGLLSLGRLEDVMPTAPEPLKVKSSSKVCQDTSNTEPHLKNIVSESPMGEPVLSSQEQVLSPQETLLSSSQEPPIIPMEPIVLLREPGVSSQEFAASLREPRVSSQEPALSSGELGVSSWEPVVLLQDPAVSSREPGVSSRHPGLRSRDKVLPMREPVLSSREPNTLVQAADVQCAHPPSIILKENLLSSGDGEWVKKKMDMGEDRLCHAKPVDKDGRVARQEMHEKKATIDKKAQGLMGVRGAMRGVGNMGEECDRRGEAEWRRDGTRRAEGERSAEVERRVQGERNEWTLRENRKERAYLDDRSQKYQDQENKREGFKQGERRDNRGDWDGQSERVRRRERRELREWREREWHTDWTENGPRINQRRELRDFDEDVEYNDRVSRRQELTADRLREQQMQLVPVMPVKHCLDVEEPRRSDSSKAHSSSSSQEDQRLMHPHSGYPRNRHCERRHSGQSERRSHSQVGRRNSAHSNRARRSSGVFDVPDDHLPHMGRSSIAMSTSNLLAFQEEESQGSRLLWESATMDLTDVETSRPRDVGFLPNGEVFVLNDHCHNLVHFSADGRKMNEISNDFTIPMCLVMTPDGQPAVTDSHERSIKLFSLDGASYSVWKLDSIMASGAAITRSGSWIVLDKIDDCFGFFPDTGSSCSHRVPLQKHLLYTERYMACDSKGRIFISGSEDTAVAVFDSDGNHLRDFGSAGSKGGYVSVPRGLYVDSRDNLLVADRHNHRVSMFAPDGRFIRHVVTCPFEKIMWPTGIDFTTTNHGYIRMALTISDNIVQVYDVTNVM